MPTIYRIFWEKVSGFWSHGIVDLRTHVYYNTRANRKGMSSIVLFTEDLLPFPSVIFGQARDSKMPTIYRIFWEKVSGFWSHGIVDLRTHVYYNTRANRKGMSSIVLFPEDLLPFPSVIFGQARDSKMPTIYRIFWEKVSGFLSHVMR
jgi:hypothetical protein